MGVWADAYVLRAGDLDVSDVAWAPDDGGAAAGRPHQLPELGPPGSGSSCARTWRATGKLLAHGARAGITVRSPHYKLKRHRLS